MLKRIAKDLQRRIRQLEVSVLLAEADLAMLLAARKRGA